MALERHHGGRVIIMTGCPVCDAEFAINDGGEAAAHFLHEHTPADFGL